MRISQDGFGGKAPKISPDLLAGRLGQECRNARLEDGALRPFRAPLACALLLNTGIIRSIFPYDKGAWMAFNQPVECMRHPVYGEQFRRVMLFGGADGPEVTDISLAFDGGGSWPAKSIPLGLPAPTAAPTATPGAAPSEESYLAPRNMAYYYTWMNAYGEESAPSPPSEIGVAVSGQTVAISGMDAPPEGRPVSAKRLYRTFRGDSASAQFHLVAELDPSLTDFEDTVPDLASRQMCPSEGWSPPPSDLHSVVQHPGGFLAGASGSDLCFSVPFRPHAWPEAWRVTLLSPIVALAVTDQAIVALTSTYPVLVTGNDPEAMAPYVRPAPQACLSARGVASLKSGVVYPSPDGLCFVANGEVIVATREVLTRDQWQALNPKALFAAVHDGRYFGFHSDAGGEPAGAFLFDPLDPENMLRDLDLKATAAWSDPDSDGLYLAQKVDGYNRVTRFDAGELLRLSWRSKRYFVSIRENLTAARIEGDYPACPSRASVASAEAENLRRVREAQAAYPGYVAAVQAWNAQKQDAEGETYSLSLGESTLGLMPLGFGGWPVTPVPEYADPELVPVPQAPDGVTFELFASGEKRFEKNVVSSDPFRLPGGYTGKDVEFRVASSNVAVRRVDLASSVQELAV